MTTGAWPLCRRPSAGIDQDFWASRYNAAFFKNNAQPGGVLETSANLGDEEFIEVDGEKLVRITEPGERNYIRPWSDPQDPGFAAKLLEVTRSILQYNREALEVLRKLASGEYIDFDPMDDSGKRMITIQGKIPLRVRFYYMVGNHEMAHELQLLIWIGNPNVGQVAPLWRGLPATI